MVGVTEQGDPSIYTEWIEKTGDMDGIILVTKAPGAFINSTLESEIEKIKDKLIIHCTITGYGHTVVEPNVNSQLVSVMMMKELKLRGYNIVLRIDPIIPTIKGLERMKEVIELSKVYLGLEGLRIRWSLIDNYAHIEHRGIELPWTSFNVPENSNSKTEYHGANEVIEYFKILEEQDKAIIETCCEDYIQIPEKWKVGCVSIRDMEIFKLPIPTKIKRKNQRGNCTCISEKHELLEHKEQCPYQCKYCYWKQDYKSYEEEIG